MDGSHIHPKGYAMTIAPTLHRYLAAENIQYVEIPHVFTMSSARTAQACHVSGDRFAKAVVLRHDGGYMLAIVPASHRLNLPDLKEKLGADLVMANETEINRLFADCAHGAVDDSIRAQPEIYIEAGDHETLLHLTHAQFERLTASAPHGRFSTHG